MKNSYVEEINKLIEVKGLLNFLTVKDKIKELTDNYKNLNLIDKDINVRVVYIFSDSSIRVDYYYNFNKLNIKNIIDIFDFNKHDYEFIDINGEVHHSDELIDSLKTIKDNRLHICGLLTIDEDDENIKVTNVGESLEVSDTISGFLCDFIDDNHEDYDEEDEEDYSMLKSDFTCDNVSIEIYATDKKVKLEEAINNKILASIGELKLYSEYYGYSEFSIEGYSIDTFTLGGHDLHEIFKSYKGKYVHILVEKK